MLSLKDEGKIQTSSFFTSCYSSIYGLITFYISLMHMYLNDFKDILVLNPLSTHFNPEYIHLYWNEFPKHMEFVRNNNVLLSPRPTPQNNRYLRHLSCQKVHMK